MNQKLYFRNNGSIDFIKKFDVRLTYDDGERGGKLSSNFIPVKCA